MKVLYLAHNYVREWREFDHLGELPCLEDLVFIGNPLEEDASAKVSICRAVLGIGGPRIIIGRTDFFKFLDT